MCATYFIKSELLSSPSAFWKILKFLYPGYLTKSRWNFCLPKPEFRPLFNCWVEYACMLSILIIYLPRLQKSQSELIKICVSENGHFWAKNRLKLEYWSQISTNFFYVSTKYTRILLFRSVYLHAKQKFWLELAKCQFFLKGYFRDKNESKTGFSKPNFNEILTFSPSIPLYFYFKPFICMHGQKSGWDRQNIVFLKKGHFWPKNGSKTGFRSQISTKFWLFDQVYLYTFILNHLFAREAKNLIGIGQISSFWKKGHFWPKMGQKPGFRSQISTKFWLFDQVYLYTFILNHLFAREAENLIGIGQIFSFWKKVIFGPKWVKNRVFKAKFRRNFDFSTMYTPILSFQAIYLHARQKI